MVQQTTTLVGLLGIALAVFSMLLFYELTPRRPRPRPVQVIRHEVIIKGGALKIETPPAWLGERISTGRIAKSGDVARLNGSAIGLRNRYLPGTRVALYVVRA